MHVIGYDPEIAVDSAWSLPSRSRRRTPRRGARATPFRHGARALVEATRGMVDAGGVAQMKPGR